MESNVVLAQASNRIRHPPIQTATAERERSNQPQPKGDYPTTSCWWQSSCADGTNLHLQALSDKATKVLSLMYWLAW